MSKIQIHQFDPVIYPYRLWVCITKDINTAVSENFIDGETLNEVTFTNTDKFKAITQKVNHKESNKVGVIIVFSEQKFMTVGTMAHEASHAAKFLFEHIGADIEAHEPFEYLLGWMVDCLDIVRKYK